MINADVVRLPEIIETKFIVNPSKLTLVKSCSQERGIDINWLRNFIEKHGIDIEIRNYQERIVVKTVNLILVDRITSILIESATGSGKTIIGLLVCKVLQELLGYNTNWCTMRRNLLVQTGKVDKDKRFHVAPKLVSMFDKSPKENDILLVDEAHHDSTSSMSRVHSKTNAKVVLLLSATPIRSDKATIFYQKCIRDSGIRALIRDGWLSRFNHYSICCWTPKTVADCYLREPDKWGKSCVFFHKYEECLEFQQILIRHGVKCELVTGKSERAKQLERFELGEVNVLVNMMVLTEGFDAPSLRSVFVRDSYRSTTVQMAGRVLRRFENTIKNVIQSQNTGYPFTKEANAQMKHVWDEGVGWKEIGNNPLIDRIASDSLHQLARRACDETTGPIGPVGFLRGGQLNGCYQNSKEFK